MPKKIYLIGQSRSGAYRSWDAMKQRCGNPNCHAYPFYGGRGISVCDRWLNSFENFLEDMGERPKNLTLERKDNSLNYSKENCKWATQKEQSRNTRSNIRIVVRGIEGCVSELCEKFGANPKRVERRMAVGWSAERAFFTPVMNSKQSGRLAAAARWGGH